MIENDITRAHQAAAVRFAKNMEEMLARASSRQDRAIIRCQLAVMPAYMGWLAQHMEANADPRDLVSAMINLHCAMLTSTVGTVGLTNESKLAVADVLCAALKDAIGRHVLGQSPRGGATIIEDIEVGHA